MKDLGPRIVAKEDGSHPWYVNGQPLLPPGFQGAAAAFDLLPGSWQLEARLKDMDVEGVEKEIVFGNIIGAYFGEPNLGLRDAIFRVHNDHMAELNQRSGGCSTTSHC